MATRADMETRIADELRRVDKTTEITRAIESAIQHFKDEGFTETERVGTVNMVDGQRTYALPSDFAGDVQWLITYDNTKYPIRRVPIQQINEWDTNVSDPTETHPSYVGLWMNGTVPSFDVYPRPQSDSDVITLYYISNVPAPASASETGNFWMNEAESLVRRYAKAVIFSDVLRQYEKGAEEEKLAQTEFNRLVSRTERRYLVGQEVTPYL